MLLNTCVKYTRSRYLKCRDTLKTGMDDGYLPVPDPYPSPVVSWNKGGMRWVYDDIYGSGQRPKTGIWATGEGQMEFQ